MWYCPAYSFERNGVRVFRCDRILSAADAPPDIVPLDLGNVHLGSRELVQQESSGRRLPLRVKLSPEGMQRCEAELWTAGKLFHSMDGSGYLESTVSTDDLPFFANFFISLGSEAAVEEPAELLETIRSRLEQLLEKYSGQDK